MDYFCHSSKGKIFSTPDDWMFISVDLGIVQFYHWLTIRHGVELLWGSKSGPHISIVKGKRPETQRGKILEKSIVSPKSLIGKQVEYSYTNQVRYSDNHAWLDVEPTSINLLRKQMGLPEYKSYHITLGRIKYNAQLG